MGNRSLSYLRKTRCLNCSAPTKGMLETYMKGGEQGFFCSQFCRGEYQFKELGLKVYNGLEYN